MTTQPDLGGVPDQERFLARLEYVMGRLDVVGHEDLGAQVIRFLRTGSDRQVLQDLPGMYAVRMAIDVGSIRPAQGGERFDLYAWFDAAPAPIALRWAAFVGTHAFTFDESLLYLPPGAEWLEDLINHVEQFAVSGAVTRPAHSTVERLLAAAGLPATTLLHALFISPAQWGEYGLQETLRSASWPGFSAAVHRHADTVRGWLPPAVRPPGPGVQIRIVRLLELLDDDTLAGFAAEAAELAVSGHREVRAAAAVLVDRCPAVVTGALEVLSRDGKPEQRSRALRLLLHLSGQAGDDARAAALLDRSAADRSAVVRAVAQEHRPQPVPDLPRLPEVHWAAEITPEVQAWARTLIDEINAERERFHQEFPAAYGPMGPPRLGAEHVAALLGDLAADGPRPLTAPFGIRPDGAMDWNVARAIRSTGMAPLELPAAVKVLLVIGCPLDQPRSGEPDDLRPPRSSYELTTAISTSRATPGVPRLLHAAAVVDALGLPPSLLLYSWCDEFHRLGWGWPVDDVEPYFAWLARNTSVFVDELSRAEESVWSSFDRDALFRAAGLIVDKPGALVDPLFAKALGTAKRDRPRAQQELAGPDHEARIIEALGDGQAGVRTQAAAWLGRLRRASAVPALERAVARERYEVARSVMIDALELLGRPVAQYLDRATLADQALTGLAKGLPGTLGWLDLDRLPPMHWADSGEPVPDDVVRWWLVQTVKLKTSEPGALLRKYCSMIDPADRERLAQFVLLQWISLDDAENAHWVTGSTSTAVAAKGVLALAAACGGREAVQVIEQFVVTNYGLRAHQGRALIGMLPWIDHPSAVQLLLALRKRFRTKSFQEEAARHIDTLAARHGWTVDELADRSLPDAGFDVSGRMLLPYGSRTLSAVLLPDLTIELRDSDDARIAALPAPRAADDEALAAAAKKALAAARKEIKTLVRQQTDRLHEAMCVHREWRFADWDAQLNRHPVVRRLVQRLVWTVVRDDVPVESFRPLDDGTLTDADDAPVTPRPDDRIRLAHDLLLAGEVGVWRQHLADYQVTPLFAQLGRACYRLPADRAHDESLTDVDGAGLEAFTLRSRATKLGYQRSAPVDGPYFDTYAKRFPGAGLTAWLQFSGNELPEENKPVTLTGTSFTGPGGALRLGEVPAVLLAECRQDLFDIAGTGDPLAVGSGRASKG